MHLHFPRFSACAFACALLAPVIARAQVYLSSGHIDLNVGYDAPAAEFGLYAHYRPDSGGPLVDEPFSNAAYFVADAGGRYATAGGILPFLGQSGQPVWLIPQNSPPATIPWVGFGGYGVGGADGSAAQDLSIFDPIPELTGSLTTPAVKITFLGVAGPSGADFALWQTGAGGAISLLFSNRPDTSAPQHFGLRQGQHIHFNWGFSQPGFYRVRLRLDGAIAGEPVPARDFAVDFAISVLPAYEQWRRTADRFTATERNLAAVGGPDADPDADGLPNLLEYALGGEPRLADSAARAPVLALSPLDATPRLTFTRLADPLLTYAVEHAAELGAESAWTSFWSSTGPANLAGPVSVPAPAPLSPAAPRAFLRLRVNHGD